MIKIMNEIKPKLTLFRPTTYRIKVRVNLDERSFEWGGDVNVTVESKVSLTNGIDVSFCVLGVALIINQPIQIYTVIQLDKSQIQGCVGLILFITITYGWLFLGFV